MATDYFYAYGIRIGGRTLEEWLRELPAGTYAAYLETDTTVKDFPVTLKAGVHIAVTVLDEIRQTGTSAAAVITVPSAAASDGKAHIVLADITADTIAYTETGAEYVGAAVNTIADWIFDPSTVDNGKDGIYAVAASTTAANDPEDEDAPLIGAMISYSYSADDRRRVLFAMTCGSRKKNRIYIRKYNTSWSDWTRLSSIDELNADYNTLDQKIDSAVMELEKQDTALGGEIAQIETDLQGKQETLVSGTNIKTVNGSSVLGAGDIVTADTKVTAITLTTDSAGAVTGGTATLSDGTQVQITVTQQTA